jgi:hypothetical protein
MRRIRSKISNEAVRTKGGEWGQSDRLRERDYLCVGERERERERIDV